MSTDSSPADPRFSNIQTDPRFRLPSKKNTHVQIDKRFAHMLHDENFSSRARVDRYGRRLPKDAGRKELEKYYMLADEDEKGSEKGADEDEEVERELERVKAEDEEEVLSSEESSSDDDMGEEEQEEVFGLLDEQEGEGGIPKCEVSSRIAVVNLDWDNIRAADLMAVFSSFVPNTGRIRKISVYPSEFGKERMEREEMEGPPKEIFGQSKTNNGQEDGESSGSEEEEEDDEGEDERIKKSLLKVDQGLEFNSAKLRRYQLERLRYYYAVLECSSPSIAQAIYDAVDGTEYLTTANFFDLRYIPDETDFSDDKARDECERIPDSYRPNEFVTDALQHSKVRLTWDADDGTRKEAQKRAFGGSRAEIDENDLKAYLGSSSSEDEGPEPVIVDATDETTVRAIEDGNDTVELGPKLSKKEAERQKMRTLLGLQNEPATNKRSKVQKNTPVGDMQITFSSGLSSGQNKGSVFENEPERDETTVEKYVRKEKERKARRKEKMKESRNDTEPTADSDHPKATSSNQLPADDQDLGFSDPFFAAPTHDKAATTSQRKAEKRLKREQRAADEAAAATKRAELELLMVDDKTGSRDMQHFDINEIAKAESVLAKKKKKKSKDKLSEREKDALAAKERDQFKINVRDERFRDVFEKSEYAIDPSHPRYKGTEGMRELLEEGRRKRKVGGEEVEEVDEERRRKKKRKGDNGGGDDVEKLVARVKSKIKMA